MLNGLVSYKDATKIAILSFISMIFGQNFSAIDLFCISILLPPFYYNMCGNKAVKNPLFRSKMFFFEEKRYFMVRIVLNQIMKWRVQSKYKLYENNC